ncbi:KH domain-containing, RNA-binding, signal transduction-associated protein 2 isoform X2 [Nilaparvata lugens]|nr:KH domain-containing, RNA-binding, signal transduction-associated protein 2 isoform X2 [Nilaparvata lugens]
MVDITRDKPIKVTIRVAVPVRDHPKFNFVGKLLGPKGNSLKRLQEDTMTKMAILGRGSMKDRHKEEELRKSGDPKFSHLNDDLHVEITSFASPAEAHARIAYALAEVRRFLVPDYNDEIRQEQMWEMHVMNSCSSNDSSNNNTGKSSSIQCSSSHSVGSNGANDCASSEECSEEPVSSGSVSPTGAACPQGQVVTAIPAQSSPAQHPALRDIPISNSATNCTGRKRPLIPGSRSIMSPTKRTVLSILARARAAQAKEITLPLNHNVRQISGIRGETLIAAGANLILN